MGGSKAPVGPAIAGQSSAQNYGWNPSSPEDAPGNPPISSTPRRLSRSGLLDIKSVGALARRTLGLGLLFATVLLWTGSNFLASTIFADDSFSKPYFVTYLNMSFFALSLPMIFIKRLWVAGGSIRKAMRGEDSASFSTAITPDEREACLKPAVDNQPVGDNMLKVWETATLSLRFCVLWFLLNFFASFSLKFTTVASTTILYSTSSIWTLLFGALIRVERFSVKKLVGVLASLTGVILISSVDLSGDSDRNRGSFPHKSLVQIAIGDGLALSSAILYGVYSISLKKRIGDGDRVDMFLFFGFIGAWSVVLLWPGFLILHLTGAEIFELPSTKTIWTIVLVNAAISLVSDLCWMYSNLLTSPLVVAVGLSLSIPLSLVGQMILNSQKSSLTYWIGAGVVVLSFVFINHEVKDQDLQPHGAEWPDENVIGNSSG
ncbi:MAG: hypothetical protein Q9187_000081 [Circinaria calcarea]